MKKSIFFSIMLTWLSISLVMYSDQSLHITLRNKSSRPAIINLIVPSSSTTIGSYGIIVKAQETKDITAPEYFWFDKVAMGGLRRPGRPSSVKIKDVLKHSMAKKMIVQVPDQQATSFDITASNHVLIIDNGSQPDTSILQFLPAEQTT